MTNFVVFPVWVTSKRRDIIFIYFIPVEYIALNTVTVLLKIAMYADGK